MLSGDEIARLAELYDQFTFSLDPNSPESDEAEKRFLELVAHYYEKLTYHLKQGQVAEAGYLGLFTPNISFHDFRKEIIVRCRKHLKATRKPPTV